MRFNSYIPRTWIIICQVFGTLFSVAGLATYIAYMGQLSDVIASDQTEGKALVAMILSILFYFTWKSIYTSVVIIRYMQRATDVDISNNRFIFSALSLSLGGLITPFILTSLPNVEVKSTINVRLFLTRVMGMTLLVGSGIGLLVLFTSALTGDGALTWAGLFNVSDPGGVVFVVMFTLYLVGLAFGGLSVGLFYGPKKVEKGLAQNQNDAYGGTLKVVSAIWMGIITVELCIVIWFAVVRLIGIIGDLVQSMKEKNGFMGIFYVLLSFANLYLTILYTFWVIQVTVYTMEGLWRKDGIQYKQYNELAKQKSKTNVN